MNEFKKMLTEQTTQRLSALFSNNPEKYAILNTRNCIILTIFENAADSEMEKKIEHICDVKHKMFNLANTVSYLLKINETKVEDLLLVDNAAQAHMVDLHFRGFKQF
jgi:hypothetical protein